MKAVVFYESAAGLAENAPLHAAAHRARWQEFADRGELLMIGPFANAQEDGAIGISPPVMRPRSSSAATPSSGGSYETGPSVNGTKAWRDDAAPAARAMNTTLRVNIPCAGPADLATMSSSEGW